MQYPSLQRLERTSVPGEYSSTWPDHSGWRDWRGAGLRYEIVAFMAKTRDATAVLRATITRYFMPAGLNIGVIKTDNGGEFQRAFQSLFAELGIRHERTPLYTPEYNGVAEWTLDLLRDKTGVMLRGVTECTRERLWAEAMAYACDMSNKCVTDSLDRDKTLYEMRHGQPPAFDTLLPFGTVGYRRLKTPAHKLTSRGAKCLVLGTAGSHDDHRPRGTFRLRDLTTGAIIWRQAVTWHPAGGEIPLAAAVGRGRQRSMRTIRRKSRNTRLARGYWERN